MRARLLALLAGACAPLIGAQAPLLYTDANMPPAVLAELVRGQELALSMDFDQADAIRAGVDRCEALLAPV